MKSSTDNSRNLRHYLHRHPELSGQETDTSRFIATFLSNLRPDKVITGLGGWGVAAIFDSRQPGYSVCFRAELDALPIPEQGKLPHRSKSKGVSHACGHDGHMAALLGLARWLDANPGEWNGKAILLFQPAEETGTGARAVLEDPRFTELNPDYMFGMHNLPGFPLRSLVLKEGGFASASSGMKLKLTGKTSHAGHPEEGNSPQLALLAIIDTLMELKHTHSSLAEPAMVTIISIRLGEEAFGTSPGEAELMATFRAGEDEVLGRLMREAERQAKAIAKAGGLKHSLKWVEYFAATRNHSDAVKVVERASQTLGMELVSPTSAFPWSEDFAFFSQRYRCAFFGLGAGEGHPRLHYPDYDFPDELIPVAVNLYGSILRSLKEDYAALELD
jgi:amidohydrolase